MDKKHIKRVYESDEVVVQWDSSKCTHSGKCVHGLPQVFNLSQHPWINVAAATADAVLAQVACCPSGALTANRKD